MELTLFELIYLIVIILLIVGIFGLFVVFELICNNKKQKYLSSLNEHDKSVILDFLGNSKLCLKDFKKKKDK